MFQAYRKKQTTTNWKKQMNKPASGNNYGIFKHQRLHKIYEISKRTTG